MLIEARDGSELGIDANRRIPTLSSRPQGFLEKPVRDRSDREDRQAQAAKHTGTGHGTMPKKAKRKAKKGAAPAAEAAAPVASEEEPRPAAAAAAADASAADDESKAADESVQKSKVQQEAEKGVDKVTDYVEEQELDSSKTAAALSSFTETEEAREKREAEEAHERELAKVKVKKEDVALIVAELEVDEQQAKRGLREAGGDLAAALRRLVAA